MYISAYEKYSIRMGHYTLKSLKKALYRAIIRPLNPKP